MEADVGRQDRSEPGRLIGRAGPGRRAFGFVLLALGLLPWTWFLVRDLATPFDAVAIGLPLLVLALLAGLLVAALLVRQVAPVAAVASVAAFGIVAIVLPWAPIDGAAPLTPVTVLAANVAGPEELQPAEAVVADVVATGADVVVVSELSPLLATLLRRSFPYEAKTFPDGETAPSPPAVGVFSTLPVLESEVHPSGVEGVRVVLDGPAGPFVLYGAHLPKAGIGGGYATSFAGHAEVVDALAQAAEAEDLPVIVAGDLNTPDRTSGYRVLTDELVDGARAGGWTGPTSAKRSLLWRLLALRIDHVLHSPSWCSADASRIDLAGSDHRGLRVQVGPCPAAGG